jgi:hypothetical protein
LSPFIINPFSSIMVQPLSALFRKDGNVFRQYISPLRRRVRKEFLFFICRRPVKQTGGQEGRQMKRKLIFAFFATLR